MNEPRSKNSFSTLYAVAAAIAITAVTATLLIPKADAEPAPAVTTTATVTATPEPAPTVTVTARSKPVAVVPSACLDALGAAEEIMNIAADTSALWSDHMTEDLEVIEGLIYGDLSGIEPYTAHIEELTDEVEALTDDITATGYVGFANTCRSEA